MVTFERINNFHYFCKNADSLIEEATKVLESISGGQEYLKEHIRAANELIFITVLARIVTREFFKQIPTLPDNVLTALVDISYAGDTYTVSLGKSLDVSDGKEKIISSYYIK